MSSGNKTDRGVTSWIKYLGVYINQRDNEKNCGEQWGVGTDETGNGDGIVFQVEEAAWNVQSTSKYLMSLEQDR